MDFPGKKILLPALLICIQVILAAQHIPGTQWKIVETEHFRVLFPEELTEQASDLAGKMEILYALESPPLSPPRISRWTIVITGEDSDVNGFVSLPPRRSVWSAYPAGESLPPLDWMDLLALHEGRHMVQYDALNRRLNRILYILGGEAGLSVGLFWGVPGWFLEGDAVGAETAFSQSGRGRDPLFFRQMKEIILNEEYSYQKMVNRSYRDYIPNEYITGYFLTSYLKNHYGSDSLDRFLNGPATVPFPALGMYLGARKTTGYSWSALYDQMARELRDAWEEQNRSIIPIDNKKITEQEERDYLLWDPLLFEEDRIVALRNSLSGVPRIVEITPERETPLIRVPSGVDITVHRDWAVWAYTRPSPVYDYRNWSDLVLADIRTGKKTILTEKKRYRYPSFSPDGRELAVISRSAEGKDSLVILNSTTGSVTWSLALPRGSAAGSPAWSDTGNELYLTLQDAEGRAVARFGRERGDIAFIKDFSFETVKSLFFYKGTLFYCSNLTGVENLMALDPDTGEVLQVSSRFNSVRRPLGGVWQGEETLLYSEYSSSGGEQLALQNYSPLSWRRREEIAIRDFLYYPLDVLEYPDYSQVLADARGGTIKSVRDFSFIQGFGNIHSWGLSPDEETGTALNLYIQSDDVLGTFGWKLGGALDVNDRGRGGFLNLNWKGGIPGIALNNRYWYRDIDGGMYQDLSSVFLLSQPLNFDRPLWSHRIHSYIGAGGEILIPEDPDNDSESSFPLYFGIQGSSFLPGGARSLNPLWGVSGRSYFTFSPLADQDRYLFSSALDFYLPGVIRDTSLVLTGSYERQDRSYQSRVLFSRGYKAVRGEELYQFSGTYEFPLFYPDLALGSWLYINRVRGQFFYDHTGIASLPADPETFRSLGGSLNFEFHPFNTPDFPLSLGVRYAWLIEEERSSIEILFMTLGL